MIAALLVAVSVGGLGLVIASLGDLNSRRASTARVEDQLRSGCRAALAQMRLVLWISFETSSAPQTLDAARAHLDALGLADGATAWLSADAVSLVGAPTGAGSLTLRPSGGSVAAVHVQVRRQDLEGDSFLFLRADATHGGEARFAEEVVRIGRRRFEGFRYALLARSVSRVLDRTTVDNAERTRLGGSGPFDRVKVGALGPVEPVNQTTIAGTFYAAGVAVDASGAALLAPSGGTNGLRAETIDATDGTLTGSPFNDLVDSTSSATPYGNFYAEYPDDPSEQFDGYFPTAGIPEAVPDVDGDRRIDDGEWDEFAADKTGRVANSVMLGVPDSTTLPLVPVGLPTLGNLVEFVGGTSDTNLLVVGTALAPTRIDGDVAVDGDLVLTGPITGNGTLFVRGNIYLLGDVTYAQPATDTVGFVAGGNLVTGDYKAAPPPAVPPLVAPVLPFLVSDSAMTGFVSQELGVYNRMEWTRTQPYFDTTTKRPTSVDTGVANSAFVAGYVPRFYAFGAPAAPQMYLGASRWDNATGAWSGGLGNPDTAIDTSAYSDHVVSPLDPTSGWINPTTLTLLHRAAALLRNAPASTAKIDGLLFSGNAVILRGPTAGSLRAMGAIIASDVGVDGATIRLDYDDRVRRLLTLYEGDPQAADAFSILRREQ